MSTAMMAMTTSSSTSVKARGPDDGRRSMAGNPFRQTSTDESGRLASIAERGRRRHLAGPGILSVMGEKERAVADGRDGSGIPAQESGSPRAGRGQAGATRSTVERGARM